MFEFFFSWRKSSKCKKLVKRVRCRLKYLKNKRSSMARIAREDMAGLISAGLHEVAFNRVEQLCNDLTLISTYELLDQFCESILMQVSYIWKHKDIPNDVNEAVSSLIFASARCGDLPELGHIRKLFTKRYGQRFITDAVELFPGNLVNPKIIEKLSGKAVADEVKQDLFLEIEYIYEVQKLAITKELSLNTLILNDVEQNVFDDETATEPDLLLFEFATGLEKQEKENSKNQELDMYLLTYKNEDGAISVDSLPSLLSDDNESSTRSCQGSRPNPGMTIINSPIFHQYSSDDASSESQIHDEEEKTQMIADTNSSSSSPAGSFRYHEEDLVYLDDIEELETRKSMQEPRTKQTLSGGRQGMDHGRGLSCFCHGEFVTRKEMAAPPTYHRRAATMHGERVEDSLGDNIMRSVSSPYNKSPRYVHPKLPDNDDIVVKFMALKKDPNRN